MYTDLLQNHFVAESKASGTKLLRHTTGTIYGNGGEYFVFVSSSCSLDREGRDKLCTSRVEALFLTALFLSFDNPCG